MKSSKYVAHSLKNNPLRTIMGVLSVLTTVMLMVAIGVVFSAGHSQFRDIFTSEVEYDIEISQTSNPYDLQYFGIPPVENVTGNINGVTGFYPIITNFVLPEKDGVLQPPVLVFCAPPEYQVGKTSEMRGNYSIGGNNIVISKDAAIKLGLDVGDRVKLIAYNKTGAPIKLNYTISGMIEVTGRFPPTADVYFVKDLEDFQSITGRKGLATSIYVTVDQSLYDLSNVEHPAAKVQNIAKAMADALGPGYRVSSLKSYLLDMSFQATGTFGSLSYVFSIIFPAISGIMIASIMNLSVEEKTHEMGVLRFLGARRSFVAKVVLLELLFMLLLSVPAGILLGMFLPGLLLSGVMGTALSPVLGLVMTQVAIAVAIILLFSLQPLLKAFNTNPIDAVRKTKKLGTLKFVGEQGVDRRLVAVGLVIFIIVAYATMVIPYILLFSSESGFIFFVMISIFIMLLTLCIAFLGIVPYIETAIVRALSPLTKRTNKLTRRNLRRYTRRNASTNVIFGVIVAILIFTSTLIGGVRVSAEDTVRYINGSDIRLTSGTPMPLSEYKKIQNHSWIDSSCAVTNGYGITASKLVEPSGTRVTAYGIGSNFSKATYVSGADLYSGTTADFERLDNESVIISRSLSVALEAGIGGKIALRTPDRNKFVSVIAVLNSLPGYANEIASIGGDNQACFVSLELYSFLHGSKGVLAIKYTDVFLKVRHGVDHEKAGTDIKNVYATNTLVRISITATLVKQIKDGLRFIEVFMLILTAMLLVVAVFSLVTNLYASVSERSYEIGVLKALGLRNSSLVSSIITESMVIALSSMLVGVIAGVLVGFMAMYWIGVFSPIGMKFAVPVATIIILVIATGAASLVGGFFPATGAARKDITVLMRKIE
jgi:putative ABC transport system permease protein